MADKRRWLLSDLLGPPDRGYARPKPGATPTSVLLVGGRDAVGLAVPLAALAERDGARIAAPCGRLSATERDSERPDLILIAARPGPSQLVTARVRTIWLPRSGSRSQTVLPAAAASGWVPDTVRGYAAWAQAVWRSVAA